MSQLLGQRPSRTCCGQPVLQRSVRGAAVLLGSSCAVRSSAWRLAFNGIISNALIVTWVGSCI